MTSYEETYPLNKKAKHLIPILKALKLRKAGNFGPLCTIFIDELGQNWQYLNIITQEMMKPQKHPIGSMPCQSLCGHNLHRFHFTCFFCRARKIYSDQMPNMFLVVNYSLLIRKDRPNSKMKDFILKRWLTIAEWLAN